MHKTDGRGLISCDPRKSAPRHSVGTFCCLIWRQLDLIFAKAYPVANREATARGLLLEHDALEVIHGTFGKAYNAHQYQSFTGAMDQAHDLPQFELE